jgi:hypothetical protein
VRAWLLRDAWRRVVEPKAQELVQQHKSLTGLLLGEPLPLPLDSDQVLNSGTSAADSRAGGGRGGAMCGW